MNPFDGMKIGIVGTAGTGKSSLARALSQSLGLQLLEAKVITQDILDRDGYDHTSGIQVERFLAHTGRQNEILRRTMEMEDSATDGFVSDRTVVDLAAYVVAELYNADIDGLKHIFSTCRRRVENYTHMFFCPWKDKPFENNDKRTLNPWYQFKIHALEIGILDSWDREFCVVGVEGTDERVQCITEMLAGK
jgi:ATPase subunit of ABC transporter with duplicated ATPase domains